MQASPLAAFFQHRGWATLPYRGGTALAGRPAGAEGPDWSREQVLVFDTSWRAAATVTGPDARKWLNGMISANVRDLQPGSATGSFQLDPRGHVLAMFHVACRAPEQFVLFTDQAQLPALLEGLRRFVFISKLSIEDQSAAWISVTLRGPKAAVAARAAGWENLPEVAAGAAGQQWLEAAEVKVLASSPGGIPQLEFWFPAEQAEQIWSRLEKVATPAGVEVYEQDRILSREAVYGADITAAELAQETGRLDFLNFSKGCYVGQEIVERVRARGAVHRHAVAFRLTGAAPLGSSVVRDGQAVGTITSVTRRGEEFFGLGYLRDPLPDADTALRAGEYECFREP